MNKKVLIPLVLAIVPLLALAAPLLFQATPPTIDWKSKHVQQLVLTSNATLTFKGGKVGEEYKLVVKQDVAGGRTITWPTDVLWSNGVAPTLTSTHNATDLIEFFYDGTNYFGSYTLNFAASPPPPPPTTLNTGLIHYWKLDEASGNATDSVGSMTLTNINSTTFTSGIINNAGTFERSSLQGFRSTAPLHTSALSAYSVCFWTNFDSIPSDGEAYQMYQSYTSSGALAFYYVRDTGGSPHWRVLQYDAGGDDHVANNFETVTLGSDYFMCTVWDGGTLTTYKNASPLTNTTSVSSIDTSLAIATGIGQAAGSTSNSHDGQLDEYGVWSRALTSSEINQLYNAGAGRQYPF